VNPEFEWEDKNLAENPEQHQGTTITDLMHVVDTVTRNGMFTDPAAALRYTLAGNAYVTLRSKNTGVRYTYRVALAKKTAEQAGLWPDERGIVKRWFVSLLTGPENRDDYSYLGVIEQANGNRPAFRLTKASKMTRTSLPVVAISWTVAALAQGDLMPEALEVWHDGRCGRCGRALTVPESVAAGIGPECAERMGL